MQAFWDNLFKFLGSLITPLLSFLYGKEQTKRKQKDNTLKVLNNIEHANEVFRDDGSDRAVRLRKKYMRK